MWQNLRVTKLVLRVVFVISTTLLVLYFGLNAILANPEANAVETNNNVLQTDAYVEFTQIHIEKANGRLKATASVADVTDWQYAGPDSMSTCNSTLFNLTDQVVRYGKEVILESVDYGRYYCFRALDGDNEYSYQNHLVIHDENSMRIVQDLDSQGQIILRVDDQQGIGDWQNVGPLAEDVCLAETFSTNLPIREESQVTVNRVDLSLHNAVNSDIYYCFRASNGDGSWSYQNRLVRLNQPDFVWERQEDRLLVAVNGISADTSGEYTTKDIVSLGCSLEDFIDISKVEEGNSISIGSPNLIYCFRIKDNTETYYYDNYALVNP